jgi:protoporphyrinogen oxidase
VSNLQIENLIVGGGISGLSLAYFLKKSKSKFLIAEKNDDIGGYCRTIKKDCYTWDYAGHFYHFKDASMKKLFLSLVEKDQIISKAKNTKIYYKDKLIDYPFQMNIHQLEQNEFCDCLFDLFFKEDKECYDNFLDMLNCKFGKSIVAKFLQPYNEKLYATDLETLDTDAMGRFFPYADLTSIVKNFKKQASSSYNDTFLYLKGGTQHFVDNLYKSIGPKNVLLDTAIDSIDTARKLAYTTNGICIKYKNLINTTPLNHFFEILGDRVLEKTIEEMSYNKVLVFNLGFDKESERYQNEHWIYFPDKRINFYRVGFYSHIMDLNKLSVYVEVGLSKNQDIDEKAQLNAVLENLVKTGIIDKSTRLVEKSVILMDPGYVHINANTSLSINEKLDKLQNNNIYSIGRYGVWTYCSMEDCMISAKELSKLLSAN